MHKYIRINLWNIYKYRGWIKPTSLPHLSKYAHQGLFYTRSDFLRRLHESEKFFENVRFADSRCLHPYHWLTGREDFRPDKSRRRQKSSGKIERSRRSEFCQVGEHPCLESEPAGTPRTEHTCRSTNSTWAILSVASNRAIPPIACRYLLEF